MLFPNEENANASLPRIACVTIIWTILSCSLGWILSFFIDPPDAIWLLYLEYADFIYYYGLFCLSMTAFFTLMPLALIFSWNALWHSFGVIQVLHKSSKSRVFVLAMLVPVMLLPGLGFLFSSDDKKSVFHLIVNLLTFLFDWIGGVIFHVSYFICFFWLIVLVSKAITTSVKK